ncbi:MAG TPA: hypothetical protein VI229_00170 [Burkholderiales bacterium]
MISAIEYFGYKPHTPQQASCALDLLDRVNGLRAEAFAAGVPCPIDPDTGTEISGSKGGAGDGGFRLETATTGRGNSSHKILPAAKPAGAGVDCFDPTNALDGWLDQFEDGAGGNSKLEEYGLYREHPDSTPGWCHLTNRAPGSGHRTFQP